MRRALPRLARCGVAALRSPARVLSQPASQCYTHASVCVLMNVFLAGFLRVFLIFVSTCAVGWFMIEPFFPSAAVCSIVRGMATLSAVSEDAWHASVPVIATVFKVPILTFLRR